MAGETNVEASAPGTGRRILLVVGATVVTVVGLIGFFVGSNNAGRVTGVEIFGTVVLPTTPWAVAAYGVVLSATALALLFGFVELASRLEERDG